jgi:starvation-inducible DNA-binding protein
MKEFENSPKRHPAVEARADLAQLLNKQLADTVDLRSQARQASFNIRGTYKEELKRMFDGQARELRNWADLLARRIAAAGGTAVATVRLVSKESRMRDYPVDALTAREHLEALLSSYSRYELNARENLLTAQTLEDPDAITLIQQILTSVEKNLWFLEASLEGVAVGVSSTKLPSWTAIRSDSFEF